MTTPSISPRDPGYAGLAPSQRTRLVRYGAAVALVTIAFLLRYILSGDLSNRLAFAFFLPAAMLAAWFGGMGPGFLAAVTGLLLGDFFFLPPHHAWGPIGDAERLALSVYSITSTIAVILMESLHARIRSLECALQQRSGEPTIPPAAPGAAP
jgi:K+-sensing histidine kinase KdpD